MFYQKWTERKQSCVEEDDRNLAEDTTAGVIGTA